MSDHISSTYTQPRASRLSWRRALAAGAGALLLLGFGAAANAQISVGGTISGQVAPGVYGRVDIGNGAPPALIYQQPVIIQQPQVVVPSQPVYMYVPPGHAKHWSKHCARYGACGQQVYFLRNPPPQFHRPPPPPPPHYYRDRDRDHGRWDRHDRHDRHDRRWDRDRDDHRGRGHGRD